jgi:toxin ParE1/3/4
MIRRRVLLTPRALSDIAAIASWIGERASPRTARAFTARIEAKTRSLDVVAERGRSLEDIAPGLRVIGFEKRAVIAFEVTERFVTVLRVYYGGQDWERSLREHYTGEA